MKSLCLLFLILSLSVGSAFAQPGARFVNGLTRAKMKFSKPDGYTKITPIDNPHMTYGHVLKNDTAAFEVRYAIRPIDDLIRYYEEGLKDSTRKIVNPNTVSFYTTSAVAVAHNISTEIIGSGPLDDEKVKYTWNADKGMLIWLKPKKMFGQNYSLCCMLCLYKEGRGNAYMFFMGNNEKDISFLFSRTSVFTSLTFKQIPCSNLDLLRYEQDGMIS